MNVIPMKAAIKSAEPAGLWPEPSPLPSSLPNVPVFEAGMLPEELRLWALDIADRMQVPLDFVAIPAMVAAGSLIGRRVGIRPEDKTDWTEVGNLWGCIVSPPGAMKSPAISEALAPIRRLEHEASVSNEEAAAKFRKAAALHKLHQETARDRAKKELRKGSSELAGLILDEVEEPQEPLEKRYMATDATVEKLGVICAANPMGILLNRDELLTMFQDLGRDEKAPARGFLLSGWSGREGYTFDRISRGTVRVPSVNLSVIGSTQPHRIGSYLRESLRTHDDGMVQRLQLLAWPDHNKRWQSTDRLPDAAAKAAAFHCYRRLSNLNPAEAGAERAGDGGDGIAFLRFAPDALTEFVAWREGIEARVRGDELPPYLAAHLSKYRGLIPRLALIYHLASGGSGAVPLEPLLAALAWAEYLEAHAVRAYASMTAPSTNVANAILRRIRKGDITNGFTERDIYRRGWSGLSDRDAVLTALKLLEDYDWLVSERVSTGGRPSTKWWVNPVVIS